ncbi:MAG: GAF domain-containing protein [Deltaproteobacteria bacterium]|nr:GAF domain-containing protein [Deltaproteobacteria bacterium]
MAILFTAVVIYQQGSLLKKDLTDKGLSIAKNLAHNSELGVFTENAKFIEPIVEYFNIKAEEDVVYAAIYNIKGKIIYEYVKGDRGRPRSMDEIKERIDAENGTFWEKIIFNNNTIYEFWAPVIVSAALKGEEMVVEGNKGGGGRPVGVVQLGLSLKGIDASLRDIIWTSISITLIFLPVGFILTYITARRIVEPISRLKKGVEAIEQGGKYEPIEIKSEDEIRHLALSFNRMVDALQKKDTEIMQHIRELSAINSVAFAVNQSLDLGITIHHALRVVIKLTGMEAGWVYLLSEDGGLLRITEYEGVAQGFIKKIDLLKHGEGIAGMAVISGEPIVEEDITNDPRITRGAIWEAGFKAFASIPLWSKEKTLGVLNITSHAVHPFSQDEREMLSSIGSQIGTAIENSMLYEKIKSQIEEIERTQDRLIHAARLASLGELSANVAHEVNNPLTGILTHTSMLMDDTPDTDPNKKRLKIIYDETIRIKHIVRNLLDFAKYSEPKKENICIQDVIKETLGLIAHLAKVSNVEIVENYHEDGPTMVSIDVAQIKQVLLNLFNNALYAMPNGGLLKITVLKTTDWVESCIEDTGLGIPQEIIHKVFDPFFTTKPSTKGTGLGLSISHGIIERHDGKIEVKSEIGKGSIFTIRLPRAKDS